MEKYTLLYQSKTARRTGSHSPRERTRKGNGLVPVLGSIVVQQVPLAEKKAAQKAWEKISGIWKGRRTPDPVQWQRKIRKEWERQLP